MANTPPDFTAIHKRAADIVKNEPMLAYAIASNLRKSVVGSKEDIRYETVSKVLSFSWNRVIDAQDRKESLKYPGIMIEIASDALVAIYDVLTESNVIKQ